jgi:predicted dehydrogenase
MLRLALVGPGRWGRILVSSVQGISDTLKFTHVVARSPAKSAAWCQSKGIKVTKDLSSILENSQIDGIVLATPHSQHSNQIIQIAQAGKNLFCEKPISLTKRSAEQAVRAVNKAEIVFAPGHNRRFLPAFEYMKKVFSNGDLGTILHVEGNMSSHVGFGEIYSSGMWRLDQGESPAGGLAAAGIHLIDLMINLLGPIESVIAQSDRLVHKIEHDDITSMLFRFKSRATGYVSTMTATAKIFRIQIFGEKGWMELKDENELIWSSVEGEKKVWSFPTVSTERLELEAFADAIMKNTPYPITSIEAINGIAAFDGIKASLQSGKRITL